jgi:UDP-N-acetyl-2-amino-2-deoxyglucuronate dehydrogenase
MLRFVLVGCGRIAKRHAELLGLGQITGASLVGVCDIDPARAAAFGETYGVPWFTDMGAMFAAIDADVASILTPSGMHADHAIAAADAGLHVVVEKPMALRLNDADAMIAACDKARRKLFVVKQNRFNVPVLKAREALDEGRFGKLVMGTVRVRWCRDQGYYDQDSWRGTWAQDGGVLSNQASHHIDLLEWFMGPVRSVHARAKTALVDIEAEDTAVATVEFMNGALGVIEATNAVRPRDLEGSLSIMGATGSVVIGGFAVNQMLNWQFSEARDEDADVLGRYSVNPPNVYGYGHQAYYEHVIHCLTHDSAALVDGLEGRRSLELITALYESIETGETVPLQVAVRHSRLGAPGR